MDSRSDKKSQQKAAAEVTAGEDWRQQYGKCDVFEIMIFTNYFRSILGESMSSKVKH